MAWELLFTSDIGLLSLFTIVFILVITYLLAKVTDLFVVGAVFCALAFLLFFRCKKPLYYAITVSMAVLIWVVFHFVLNVSF